MKESVKINSLDWDSEFFNLRVGEILLKPEQKVAKDIVDFDLIYVKSTNNNVEIDGYKNTYSELKITFSKPIQVNISSKENNIDSVFNIDVKKEGLYNIAFISGKYSRFKLDENLKTENFENLYKIWVDNTLNRTFADDMLVYNDGEELAGLLSYKLENDVAKVELFAVDSKSQRHGIGTKLLNKLEQILFNKNINKIYIPTQKINKQACKFYKKLGYEVDSQIYISHYWKL